MLVKGFISASKGHVDVPTSSRRSSDFIVFNALGNSFFNRFGSVWNSIKKIKLSNTCSINMDNKQESLNKENRVNRITNTDIESEIILKNHLDMWWLIACLKAIHCTHSLSCS